MRLFLCRELRQQNRTATHHTVEDGQLEEAPYYEILWKGECRYCRGLGFRPTTEEGEAIIDFIERYKHIIKKILGREEN